MTIMALTEGYEGYQEWVIHTYGDLSRTKTITLRKCARIQRVLRGEETACAENSKFRFWVRNKGFREKPPPGYIWRPADQIKGRQGGNMELFVPTGNKDIGSEYKKVAIVENFYDIIHGVHVDIDGKGGKHAGQKRTYRTITETYAFLPREAVTKFLLSCTECQRRPASPAIKRSQPLPINPHTPKKPKINKEITDLAIDLDSSLQQSPENLCKNDRACPQYNSTPLVETILRINDASCSDPDTPQSLQTTVRDTPSSTDTSDSSLENLTSHKPLRRPIELARKGIFERNDIYNDDDGKRISIYYPIPKRDGRKKFGIDELFAHDLRKTSPPDTEEVGAVPDAESPEEDSPYSKDAEKLKMMLLAWNASGAGRNGEEIPEDAASLWNSYHSPVSLAKQAPPIRASPTQDAASVHDETSSSGNKDDDDDENEDEEEKIDPQKYDPERLKAFNMFVRLFVDENLDRIVPISKQPKEKIQAIIDSCTRQFPEFSDRARKRIRTYLKSCRRNKRCRDGGPAWEPVRQSRPTPAHLTSVQAEQLLAQACENESHNAKRMRLGMEPVTQPMPGGAIDTVVTARSNSAADVRDRDMYSSPISATSEKPIKLENNSRPPTPPPSKPPMDTISLNNLSPTMLNGSAPPSTVAAAVAAAAAAPTAMYRPNFSQAFQRAAASYGAPGLFPLPCGLTNGPADLSMKSKPLLSHKLNPAEMTAVRQLVTGYRESAAFLLRSADELEQLLRNQ